MVEVNCAQVTSVADLLDSIARTQNVRDKTPLLFLDEADTNESYFAAMLAPLWDSSVTIRGDERRWPKRMVSILVASRFDDVASFLKFLGTRKTKDKRLDLRSRLNGPRLSLVENKPLTVERRTSRVYLTAQSIVQYHPEARMVERGLFDLVYSAPELIHGPSSTSSSVFRLSSMAC